MKATTERKTTDQAAAHVQQMLDHVSMTEQLPLTTDAMLRLLQLLDYEVDEDRVAELLAAERFQRPPLVKGEMRWHAVHVCAMVTCCEALRLWQYPSELHDFKRSRFEVAIEDARAKGELPELLEKTFRRQSLRELLLLMVSIDNRMAREQLWPTIAAKLESDGLRV